MVTMLKQKLQTLQQRRTAPLTVSETQRTRGRAWMERRARVMRRDCGMCQECRRKGWLTAAVACDHRIPLWEGGTDDDDNLQALCKDCHDAKTAQEAARRAGRG